MPTGGSADAQEEDKKRPANGATGSDSRKRSRSRSEELAGDIEYSLSVKPESPKLHNRVASQYPSPQIPALASMHGKGPSWIGASHAGPSRAGGETMVSVVEAAEAHSSGTVPQARLSTHVHKSPDPVDLHMLSLAEADSLFRQFFKHQNPLIKLFDRHLHTVAYVRQTSTVLFSSLLAVSAKHFRPDLYPSLHSQATTLIAKGVFGSHFEIGLLQSLMLLVYWKEPGDATAFFRVGIIIRLAMQLRLPVPRTTPLPDDEHEARLILDRERTWLNAICFDSSYSFNFDEMIDAKMIGLGGWADLRLDDWLDEGMLYDVPEDALLVASIETTKSGQACRNIQNCKSEVAADMLVTRNRHRLEQAWSKYLKPESLNKSRLIYFIAWANLAKAQVIAHNLRQDLLIDEYLPRAAQLISFAVELIDQGELVYVQDFFAHVFFKLAEFLAKILPMVLTEYQRLIVQWMSDFCASCTRARKDRDDNPPAYLARYYRLVLRSIASQDQARSRATSVAPQATQSAEPHASSSAATANATADPLSFTNEIGSLLPMPDLLNFSDPRQDFEALTGISSTNDSQYWSSVLQGPALNQFDDQWSWLAPAL
ncbi:hypothetical protein OIO90_001735 [Microbotryomycetes sp. JL221]|nr:hypothetical protein OIO90_001735 [Microbotryomycetes sp. JL221]